MMRRYSFLVLLLLGFATSSWMSVASAQEPPVVNPPSTMNAPIRPSDELTVSLPLREGRVAWSDISDAVATQLKLDAPTLADLFPSGELDLRSGTALLTLLTVNLTMGDVLSLQIANDQQGNSLLVIRCKQSLASNPALMKPDEARVTIDVDSDWKSRTGDSTKSDHPLLVFLHGMKSDGTAFRSARDYFRMQGFATAAVIYDPAVSIAVSAAKLSSTFASHFDDQENQVKFALVGHSMGGLVAREWVEHPGLDNHRVVQLITLGTPHQGSAWATLPPLLEAIAGEPLSGDDIIDLLLHQPADAGQRDLAPHSKFLTMLNTRARRPNLRYTTIAGTSSPVDKSSFDELRRILQSLDRDGSVMRLIRPRIAPLLAEEFHELESGKGDGVVSVSSATFAGVQDVVQVNVSHFEMVGEHDGDDVNPVWTVILDRLTQGY